MTGTGKVPDFFHRQQVIVRLPICLHFLTDVAFLQRPAVLLNQYNPGMFVGDPDFRAGCAVVYCNDHIQQILRYERFNLHRGPAHVGNETFSLLFAHMGKHFEPGMLIAGQCADAYSSCDASLSAGIGDHYALHVFDDIPAGFNRDPVRQCSEGCPCDRGAISQRHRLRASHGADQLAPENLQVSLINHIIAFHTAFSFNE